MSFALCLPAGRHRFIAPPLHSFTPSMLLGIFDSGLGGLTVSREIMRLLPGLDITYFGDTARMPYGNKSPALVRKFAVENARFLMRQGADAIVIACNTGSAVAVDDVRRLGLPTFDVVTPAARRAAEVTSGRVGVIGTRATIVSLVYERLLGGMRPGTIVTSQACPLFVPLVEEGWAESAEALTIATSYLRPLRLAGVDTLILGCTHYPFLRKAISSVIGDEVNIIDPATRTAEEVQRFFLKNAVDRTGSFRCFISDRTEHFERLAAEWLGRNVKVAVTDHERDSA